MGSEIVNYRPSWQRLRVSTLKENNPYGGMTTPQGATDAMQRMFNYMNDADPKVQGDGKSSSIAPELERMNTTIEEEYACRVYRVYNFLKATTNGLVTRQNLPHVMDIGNYAHQLEPNLNLHLVQQAAGKWNWEVIRFELEELWRKERNWFMMIYADMRERVVEKDKYADEMTNFIGLMNEVNSLGTAN